jgi:hypothetical protein
VELTCPRRRAGVVQVPARLGRAVGRAASTHRGAGRRLERAEELLDRAGNLTLGVGPARV